MSIFQHTVVLNYINSLDKPKVAAAYAKFKELFHNAEKQENIRNSKEEQFQEGFIRDLFCSVLGYTINPNPNYNIITEQKNETNAKKADAAILINNKVVAVIELKGTDTTDLNRIEAQAFVYKNNNANCIYVITSNLEKLRLYINDTTDYLEFNLFTLSADDFNLLWLCLELNNVQNNVPKTIKEQSLSAEDTITKELYKDYSAFKNELYANIVSKNTQYDKLLLFKKTQKLLDRFLFIFFAEDRLLLPPNSIRSILTQWETLNELDNYVSLYSRFQKYFGYMNTGHKGKQHDIYAYNGGLFVDDDVLDAILIDDEILYKHSKKLSDYDFESEVDVNILGHIFENSLNQIDEISNELEGKQVDASKSKRKKDGVFYTPKYITKYIVDNTVGKLCTEKKLEIGIIDEDYTNDKRKTKERKKQLLDKLTAYRDWLLQLTICDPACGSGAFLNQALEFLIKEHAYLDELTAKLLGASIQYSEIENSILEHNLFGVDINEEAVEIAKLSLWLRTAKRDRKLNNLSNTIKCGNSLIDDATVAGEKAFDWFKEFPQVFGYTETTEQELEIKTSADKKIKKTKEEEEAVHYASSTDSSTSSSKEKITNVDNRITNVDDRITNVEEPKEEYQNKKKGFDVVIGNPPYGASLKVIEKEYIRQNYTSMEGEFDTYIYFIETSLSIGKSNCQCGFIVPNNLLQQKYGRNIRKMLLEKTSIEKIIDLGLGVFSDAVVPTLILHYRLIKPIKDNIVECLYKPEINNLQDGIIEINQTDFYNNEYFSFNIKINLIDKKLISKLELNCKRLKEVCELKIGIEAAPEYITDTPVDSFSKPMIRGRNFNRYAMDFESDPKYIHYERKLLHRPREERLFDCPKKIVIRQTGDRVIASIDTNRLYAWKSVFVILCDETKLSYEYLLTLIN